MRSGFCKRVLMATTHRTGTSVQPAFLTAIALAIGGMMALFVPLAIVGLYALTLPVALVILWAARDVEAPIDRILGADAQREQQQQRSAPRAEPALAKAA